MQLKEQSPPGSLRRLPGVNVDVGLRVTRNNYAMYRRLLVKFLQSWGDYRKEFGRARDEGLIEVQLLAHNLKGVAANLGIEGVQQLAGDLEISCRNQRDNTLVAETCQRLFNELDRVLAGLVDLSADPGSNK